MSDNGKAAVVSEASEFQTRTWAILNDTQSAILERVKPGISTKKLWQVFVDRFNRANLKPAILFLGHGLGLGLHEEPYISATSDTILEPGMVFCIEPVYKISGQMGFHIEDEILVTEKGHEVFTDIQASRELAVIRSKGI